MGYRNHLAKCPKDAYLKYRGKSEKEIREMDGVGDGSLCYDIPEITEIIEGPGDIAPTEGREPFFSFEDPDEECWIVTKEWLKEYIEAWRVRIHEHFEGLLKGFSSDANGNIAINPSTGDDLFFYITHLTSEWSGGYDLYPYNLEPEKRDLHVSSSKYEYAIFNLVHLYRTFDWEKDFLLLNGW